jgi:hypothetical protein
MYDSSAIFDLIHTYGLSFPIQEAKMTENSNTTLFTCKFCGKTLVGVGSLNRHIKTSKLCFETRGEKCSITKLCSDCKYRTALKSSLLRHFESCKLRKLRLQKEELDRETELKENNTRLKIQNDIIQQQFEEMKRQLSTEFWRPKFETEDYKDRNDAGKHPEEPKDTKTDAQIQKIKADTELLKVLSENRMLRMEAEIEKMKKENNNLKDQLESQITGSADDGFIYVIKEREFMKTGENVFKIGRTTRSVNRRLREYPKGSKPYYFESVKNSVEIERLIIQRLVLFSDHFTRRIDIGSEYFEGNIQSIISAVKSVTCEINTDYLRFIKH